MGPSQQADAGFARIIVAALRLLELTTFPVQYFLFSIYGAISHLTKSFLRVSDRQQPMQLVIREPHATAL